MLQASHTTAVPLQSSSPTPPSVHVLAVVPDATRWPAEHSAVQTEPTFSCVHRRRSETTQLVISEAGCEVNQVFEHTNATPLTLSLQDMNPFAGASRAGLQSAYAVSARRRSKNQTTRTPGAVAEGRGGQSVRRGGRQQSMHERCEGLPQGEPPAGRER